MYIKYGKQKLKCACLMSENQFVFFSFFLIDGTSTVKLLLNHHSFGLLMEGKISAV